MTRNIWNRVVAGLFDKKKTQVREQTRRRRLGLEWLEERVTPAVDYWTGAGANNLWSTAANWSRVNNPLILSSQQAPVAGDDLKFLDKTATGTVIGNRNTVDNIAGLAVNSIQISGLGYTLGGTGTKLILNTVGPGVGGSLIVDATLNGPPLETISLDLQLGAAAPSGITPFTFNIGSNLFLTGHLSGGANATLNKTGTATLTLSADNSTVNGGFLGAVSDQQGAIAITNSKALGTGASTTTVAFGAQLQLAATGLNVIETLDLASTANGIGGLYNLVGSNVWAGAIGLDNSIGVSIGGAVGTTLNISGQIYDKSPTTVLDKVGKGMVIFSHHGGNTYGGITSIDDGVLRIQDPLSLGRTIAGGSNGTGTVVNANASLQQFGTLQLAFGTLNAFNGLLTDPSKPFNAATNPYVVGDSLLTDPTKPFNAVTNPYVVGGDISGVLTDPTKFFNAATNPYVGFQVFDEQLTLNGTGFGGIGALQNFTGNNIWNGNVILGTSVANAGLNTPVSIGVSASTAVPPAPANTNLTISGVISDPNRAPVLQKTGTGRLILTNNNTFRGFTDIQQGVIQVNDSHALGNIPSEGGSSAIVENGAGLELGVDKGLDGTPLRTHKINLGYDSTTKNGPGQELFIPATVPATVGTFTLSVVSPTTTLTETTASLNFASPTLAADIQTALNALATFSPVPGVGGIGGVSVTQTGNLFLVSYKNLVLASTRQIPLLTYTTAVAAANPITVNPIYGLVVAKPLTLIGTGFGGVGAGAVDSVSGVNTYTGPIFLSAQVPIDSIGVNPDGPATTFGRVGHPTANVNYLPQPTLNPASLGINYTAAPTNFAALPPALPVDYSLTVSGGISGGDNTTLQKVGGGNLILRTANSYSGPTEINQGWITIQDTAALGIADPATTPTLQPAVTVDPGAALHLYALPGTTIVLARNLVLSGLGLNSTGILSTSFNALNQEGSLMSLAGSNLITGGIKLATPNVGIGVQDLGDNLSDELTLTGTISEINPLSGITKLGTQHLILQGAGTYTGSNSVQEGTLSVRNDTALGRASNAGTAGGIQMYQNTTTTVQTGSTLELGNDLPTNNGGLAAGVQVTNENLVLNDAGQQIAVSGTAARANALFTLSFNGAATSSLPAKALNIASATLALDIQTALNALTTISGVGGNVTVTKNALGTIYTVVFGGTLADKSNSQLIVTNLTPPSPNVINDARVRVIGSTAPLTTEADDNVGKDILWTGDVSLAANTVIEVAANSRLTIGGIISDTANTTSAFGSNLTVGQAIPGQAHYTGELVLAGTNTYRGTTFVANGILTAANNAALGAQGDILSQQTLTLTGSFQYALTLNGQSSLTLGTSGIYDSALTTAAYLQNALNSLTAVTGGPGGNGSATVQLRQPGNVFVITFKGNALLGTSPQLGVNILTIATPGVTRNANPGSSATVSVVSSGTGGTVVENDPTTNTDGQLQIEGSLNITNEALTIQGNGLSAGDAPTSIPVRWFNVGPASINGGVTAGNQAVTGTVNSVVSDPQDPKVMYLATAGGGAWKTLDGGLTWTQLFDGISAVQQVVVNGASSSTDTFSLTFKNSAGNSSTTAPIAYNATAEQVQAALNAISSINGLSGTPGNANGIPAGSVSVTRTVNAANVTTYLITFSGGSFADAPITSVANPQPLTATNVSGTVNAFASTVSDGINSSVALFTGSIAVSPTNPSVIYLGTGSANNEFGNNPFPFPFFNPSGNRVNESGDSYYGTGVYKSADAGKTWALLTNAGSVPGAGDPQSGNPLYGQSVSKLVVDPFNADIVYVATSNQNIQQVPNLPVGQSPRVPGIWRYGTQTGSASANTWVNLTAGISNSRLTSPGQGGTVGPSPGPLDDFRISFPQNTANWTDLSVVGIIGRPGSTIDQNARVGTSELYAALGNSQGTNVFGSNGVFRTADPGDSIPTWYVGKPGATQSEVILLTITTPQNSKGSATFQLTFRGVVSNIQIDANRGTDLATNAINLRNDIQTALDNLPNIGAGNTSVIIAPGTTPQINIDVFQISFQNALANLPEFFLDYDKTGFAGTDKLVFSEKTPGGGIDDRSTAEFPTGSFTAPFPILDGTIKFTTAPEAGTYYPDPITLNGITIYASIANPNSGRSDGATPVGIWVSHDGGQTWAATAANPPNYFGVQPPNFAQSSYDDTIVAVSTTHVYVAGTLTGNVLNKGYIYETIDGGATWTDVSFDKAGNGPHTNAHSMFYDVNTGNLLIGTDGGVWSLNTNTDTYTDINGDLSITELNSISANPLNSNNLISSGQGIGAAYTYGLSAITDPLLPTGLAWKGSSTNASNGGNGGPISFDPNNPLIAYQMVDNKLYKSTDGGKTFPTLLLGTSVNPVTIADFFTNYPYPNTVYAPLVVDPVNTGTLSRVVVGGTILRESLDGGSTWIPLNTKLPINNVTALALASYQGPYVGDPGSMPVDTGFPQVFDTGANSYTPNTIYVTDSSSIFVTKDGGQSWQQRRVGGAGTISSLTVDPSSRDTVYFTSNAPVGTGSSGRVFRSLDAGQTWMNLSDSTIPGSFPGLPDLPVYKLVVDPRTGSLFVGTENGVWTVNPIVSTTNPTPTWQRFGAGMPDVKVTDLQLSLTSNTLTAATYGRGAFQAYLGEVVPQSGALRVVSGVSTWTGSVYLNGNNPGITVDGTQAYLNGLGSSSLNILGVVSDLTATANALSVGYEPGLANNNGLGLLSSTLYGGGTLIFSGANSYAAATTVYNGTLVVNNPSALGATSSTTNAGTTVLAGAALALETDLNNENVTLNGDGLFYGLNQHHTGALRNLSSGNATNTLNGNVILASNTTIGTDPGSTLTITGQISGAFNLTKESTGTLDLAAANTYSGDGSNVNSPTTVNQGTLQLENSTAMGNNSTATVLGGAELELKGNGLQIAQNLILSGTGLATLGNGGGAGALLNTGRNNTVKGNIYFQVLPSFSASSAPAGTVAIGSAAGTTLTVAGLISETLPIPASGTTAYSGSGYTVPTGLTKLGLGTVILQSADKYSGTTYVSQGTLTIQNSGALGTRDVTTAPGAIQRIVTTDNKVNPAIDPVTGIPIDSFEITFPGLGTVQTFPVILPTPSRLNPLPYGASAKRVEDAINEAISDPAVGGGYTASQLHATVTDAGAPNPNNPPPVTNAVPVTTTDMGGTVAHAVFNTNNPPTSSGLAGGYVYTVNFTGTLATTLTGKLNAFGQGNVTAGASTVADGGVGTLVANGAELDLQGLTAPISTPLTMEIALNGTGFSATGGIGHGALYNLSGNFNLNSPNTIQGLIDIETPSTIGADAGTTLALTGTSIGTPLQTASTIPSYDITTAGPGTLQVDGNFGNNFDLTGGTLSGIGIVGGINGITGGGLVHPGDNLSHTIGTLTTAGVSSGNPLAPLTPTSGNVTLSANDQFFVDLGLASSAQFIGNNPMSANPFMVNGANSLLLVQNGRVDLNGAALSGALLGAGHHMTDGFEILETDYDGGANPLDVVGSSSFAGLAVQPTQGGLRATLATIGQTSFEVDYFIDHITVTQLADSSSTSITSSVNPSVYGQAVTFTATVTFTGATQPMGIVNFYSNGSLLGQGTYDPVAMTWAYTTTPATQLAASNNAYNITANYVSSNGLPTSMSIALPQTVNKDATRTGLVVSPNPSSSGDPVTFTATVVPDPSSPGSGSPTGFVQFFDGATAVSGNIMVDPTTGVASFVTSSLLAGSHQITAVYSGDSNFFTSTSSIQFATVVSAQRSNTSVTSSQNPSTFGQSVTFTATVTNAGNGTATPTGNVVFQVDGGTGVNGQNITGTNRWTFTISNLPQGTRLITAAYSGDNNYLASNGSVTQTVLAATGTHGTSTGIVSNANPAVIGQSVTFTATVTPTPAFNATPTGNVFFTVDGGAAMNGTSIGGGKWTFTTSFATPGTHNIVATYGGDVNYAISTGTFGQPVGNVGTTFSTTSAITSSSPAVFQNSPVTFSVKVTDTSTNAVIGTGTVTFTDNGVSIGTGTFNAGTGLWSLTTSFAMTGTHPITATFSGNAIYAASNSPVFNQSVTTAGSNPTTTGNVSSNNPGAVQGQPITFSVTVTGSNLTGTVTFLDNGVSIGTGTAQGNGIYTLTTSTLAAGSHSITASYSGDAANTPSMSPTALPQFVKGATTTSIASSNANPAVNTAVTFTGHVSSTFPGSPSGTVTIFKNGVPIGTVAVNAATGNWSFAYSFPTAGTFSITAAYNGDGNYGASLMSGAVTETVKGGTIGKG